jgi:hypothetical protein
MRDEEAFACNRRIWKIHAYSPLLIMDAAGVALGLNQVIRVSNGIKASAARTNLREPYPLP